jgi:hypothetical protein
MRALAHNRLELVEAYAELRRPLEDAALDAAVTTMAEAMAAAGQAHFGAMVELVLHVERRRGQGHGPAFRVTALTSRLSAWFPPQSGLRAAARQAALRGRRFARDVLAALAAVARRESNAIARREVRRKAPGKLLDLFDRIEPARVLGVARRNDLAARERDWLGDDIANLRRAVHSDAMFARLMTRLRRETEVPFLPARPEELKTLRRKMVGVPVSERRLHRRRALPRFAAAAGPRDAVALRFSFARDGKAKPAQYFGD